MEQIFTANLPLSINFIRLVATTLGVTITLSLFLFIFSLIRDIATKEGSLFTATAFLCFSTGFSTLVAVSLYCLLNLIPHYFLESNHDIFSHIGFFVLSIAVFLIFSGIAYLLERFISQKNLIFSSIFDRLSISDYEGFRYILNSLNSSKLFYAILIFISVATRIIDIFAGHTWSALLLLVELCFLTYPCLQRFKGYNRTIETISPPVFLDKTNNENNMSYSDFLMFAEKRIDRLNNLLHQIEKDSSHLSKHKLEEDYRREQISFFSWIYPYFVTRNERDIVGDYFFFTNADLKFEQKEIQKTLNALKEASNFISSNGITQPMVETAKALAEGSITDDAIVKKYRNPIDVNFIKDLSLIYSKATALSPELQRRHFLLFENIIKHLFYYSNLMTDLNAVSVYIKNPKRAIKSLCKSSAHRFGKYSMKSDIDNKYFNRIRDSIVNVLFHGRYFNLLTLHRKRKELTEVVNSLKMKPNKQESFLVYSYGIGLLTEFELPLEKRDSIVSAANTLTEIYNQLLPSIQLRKQIEGRIDFCVPPLRLTEKECETLQYMIDVSDWANDNILNIKNSVATHGILATSKNFVLNEGVIIAILEFDEQFKKHIKWEKDERISYVGILQQAWNLIQRGCEYDLENGVVAIPFFPRIKSKGKIGLKDFSGLFTDTLPPRIIIQNTDMVRVNYSSHFYDERNRRNSEHDAIYGCYQFIDVSLKYIYCASDITKLRITARVLIEKHNQSGSYKYMLSNFVKWLRRLA